MTRDTSGYKRKSHHVRDAFDAGKHRFYRLPRAAKYTLRIASIAILIGFLSSFVDSLWRPVQHPNYGVSFSYKASKQLGLDWQANYTALLDDLQFKHLRLMSYWDVHEPKKGEYDYSILDYQMAEAAKRGATASLSIGLRQPRWPECHQPEWAKNLGQESSEWKKALYTYIETTVNRYKSNPVLESYQLENEAYNSAFGDCNGAAPKERIAEEFALVKRLDNRHPVKMSLSDEHGLPLRGAVPDEYGFSVYRRVWNGLTPVKFYTTYPTPVWYHRLRKTIIEHTKHRPVFIHELQAEPWGPRATEKLSIAEQNKSMSIDHIHDNFSFARKIGTVEIDTWGGEWWYWRKTALNDDTPWEAVRYEIAK